MSESLISRVRSAQGYVAIVAINALSCALAGIWPFWAMIVFAGCVIGIEALRVLSILMAKGREA